MLYRTGDSERQIDLRLNGPPRLSHLMRVWYPTRLYGGSARTDASPDEICDSAQLFESRRPADPLSAGNEDACIEDAPGALFR